MNTRYAGSHTQRSTSQTERRQFVVPALLLLLAAVSLITIDAPLSHYALEVGCADEVHKALMSVEPFGTIYGITIVLIAIVVMTPGSQILACRVGGVGIAGGLSAGLIKLLVCRSRPKHFVSDHSHILDNFQGFLPIGRSGGGWQSFPSAHTAAAVAFAFAVALAFHFPRARWLWYSLAALVGLQRVEVGQHFASDVFVGAAVGWTIAKLILTALKSLEKGGQLPTHRETTLPADTHARAMREVV